MPGAPMRTACVEEGSVAGLGRAGGDGGTLMVSLAADARAAAPRRERIEGICMVGDCHDAESMLCVGVGFKLWTMLLYRKCSLMSRWRLRFGRASLIGRRATGR